MAKEAARVGDPLSHGGSITKGSSNVFINGKPAAYVTSEAACSADGKQTISKGSATVFINGKPAVRVNDTASCGATVTSGSSNVFIGDGGSPIHPDVAAYILSRQQTPMSFAELAALLGVVPFGMERVSAADCFDEQVHLLRSGGSAGLPFFIETADGRQFSGQLDAEGKLPRVATEGLENYDIYWGDDALAKG
ncbi:PAAR domain-containing protein [Paraherbaspirillum soli]|uniref:PAAR domain-containing protein n=1 Tax=Paraherbaspirillum soli TaxID=631222 RepID=A0ABW0MAN7_9BURK